MPDPSTLNDSGQGELASLRFFERSSGLSPLGKKRLAELESKLPSSGTTEGTLEQRALELSYRVLSDAMPPTGNGVRDAYVMLLKALREERARAWDEYANFVRDTWGRAYSTEFFPALDMNQFDSHVRSVVSGSMGRHMAKCIEEQLRELAAEARKGKGAR